VFFVLSKILDLAFAPLSWVLALLVLLLLRPSWSARIRGFVLVLALLVLSVFSTESVAIALVQSLEAAAVPTYKIDGAPYDAVVLLGGMVETRQSSTAGRPFSFGSSSERLMVTFELLRENRAKFVILSGGTGDSVGETDAGISRKQLEKWGIASERILLEDKARNTYENAVFTRELARTKGLSKLVIVTSAFHMPRAYGCFNAAGLAVDTLPADYRGFDTSKFSASLQPRSDDFDTSTWALREWSGRLIYRVRGYTSETLAPSL
jgi:uncharacterized SAM-binding protein YcdF (DUF218 family)